MSPKSVARLHKTRELCLLSMLLILATSMVAQDPSAELSILGKWIETKKDNAALRSGWIVKKQDLLQEEALLEAEAKSLTLQLETLSNLKATLLQDIENATVAQSDLREQIERFESKLTFYTGALSSTLAKLPPPLSESIQSLLKQSPNQNNSLGARYQRLIAALSELHAFSNQTHYQVEIHSDSGGVKKQMDTLYWGLSLAYSCDATGQIALLGRPSENGWQWTDISSHAPVIRNLLDVQKGILPPAYVSTPTSNND